MSWNKVQTGINTAATAATMFGYGNVGNALTGVNNVIDKGKFAMNAMKEPFEAAKQFATNRLLPPEVRHMQFA